MGVIEGPRVKKAADELNLFLSAHDNRNWGIIEEYNAIIWDLKKKHYTEGTMPRREYEEGRLHYYNEYNKGSYEGKGLIDRYDQLRRAVEYEKYMVARAKKYNPLETDPSKPSDFMTYLDDKLLDPSTYFTLEEKITALEKRDQFDREERKMTALREEVKRAAEQRKRRMARGR